MLSSEANKVAKLVHYLCTKVPDNNFVDVFASSVQYLVANEVAVELYAEKVECYMNQGDKVVSSAVEELTRSKDVVLVNKFLERSELINKLRDMVKHFESNPTNRKHYDLVL